MVAEMRTTEEKHKKVWYVHVSQRQMQLRIIACIILTFMFVVYFWLTDFYWFKSQIFGPILLPLLVFYFSFDVLEYLQTGKVVSRKNGPSEPMTGVQALIHVSLSLVILAVFIYAPHI